MLALAEQQHETPDPGSETGPGVSCYRVIDLGQKWKDLIASGANLTIDEAHQMAVDLIDSMGRVAAGGS